MRTAGRHLVVCLALIACAANICADAGSERSGGANAGPPDVTQAALDSTRPSDETTPAVLLDPEGAAPKAGSDPDDAAFDPRGPAWARGLTQEECAATLDAGDGGGAPGSGGNLVSVLLTNNVTALGVSFTITDSSNALSLTGCTSLVPSFTCTFSDDGTSGSVSLGTVVAATIPTGSNVAIVQLSFDVAPAAADGTVTLGLQGALVTPSEGKGCPTDTLAGTFEVAGGAVCGNGDVEGAEQCDDGNTAGGDCCSALCAFEALGSSCEDNLFCTVKDACDDAGTCVAGPPRSCDDDDICTDDACNDGTNECENIIDPTNDPSCLPCAVELAVGSSFGAPGSTGNAVRVTATTNRELSAVQLVLTDTPEVLTASGCLSLVAGFSCVFNDNSSSASVTLSTATSAVIPAGGGVALFDILYDVDGGASEGEVTLGATGIVVADANEGSCTSTALSGSFTVATGAFCGNEEVEAGEECDDGNTAGGDCCSAECTFEASQSGCEDGAFCTVLDVCDGAGSCLPGSPRDCADDDICTDDSCDEDANECENIIDPTNDPSCEGCIAQLAVGTGSGLPGSTGNVVSVSLTNTEAVSGVELTLADVPDILTATGCTSLLGSFICTINEDGSSVAVSLGSLTTATIPAGGPTVVLQVLYDVDPSALATSVSLGVSNAQVVDADEGSCGVTATAGSFEVPAVCGNGAVETGEQCDDGNTAGGDCCSAVCTFEGTGSACEDGLFCTVDDACNGLGDCLGGPARTCDDDEVCTDDSCNEGTDDCSNVFDTTNDPSCLPCLALLDVGSGSGAAGSTLNTVPVSLFANQNVASVTFTITDVPDVLVAAGCNALVAGFTCTVLDDGTSASATLTSPSSAVIPTGGTTTILELLYDVDAAAVPGNVSLEITSATVIDAGGFECEEVTTAAGSFTVNPAGEDAPILSSTSGCAFPLGTTEVCFDFQQGADDSAPGGIDEITAVDWCINWDPDELAFDCSDAGGDGVPDALSFFVDPQFATFVECTPTDPLCKLRFTVVDLTLPFAVLEDGALACMTFSLQPGAEDGETLDVLFVDSSASDTLGNSLALALEADSILVSDCCVGDCNDDGRVDIADAVSIVLEVSDDDGDDACDTLDDVPFAGVPCCDCNRDERIDIADAVCVVNGIGDLECPSSPVALESAERAALSMAADTPAPTPQTAAFLPPGGLATAQPTLPPALRYDVESAQGIVRVPIEFSQGSDDGRPGGRDAITAFNACVDFDPAQLALDPTDGNADGIPDAVRLSLPPTHVRLVRVDLTRPDCEIQIGGIDLMRPSAPLPSRQLAVIEFTPLGTLGPNAVRAGNPSALSFADVLAISHEGVWAVRGAAAAQP